MPRRWARGLAALATMLLLATACSAQAVATEKQVRETSDPVPAGSVAAFYGDSLTMGLGATSPEQRWASLLSARRGWTEVNPSIPGLGFVQARGGLDLPAQIVEARPDVVFVTLGINDLWLVESDGASVETAIASDLERLRAGVPDARILVFALFSPLAAEPPQATVMNGWLRASAAQVGATFVTKSSHWLVDRREWTVDGIHFNDAGNAAIADLMDAELRRLFGPSPAP
ncbi:MAG: SGNH/GDSL hydrolase family protein [Pseudolysinimonas sp.]|uniref:SGNH/GDSL hydrolase family protein n=1 Tax=Pseudolysinimonas sp. TaxID=2680009 RepID=UPI003C73672C